MTIDEKKARALFDMARGHSELGVGYKDADFELFKKDLDTDSKFQEDFRDDLVTAKLLSESIDIDTFRKGLKTSQPVPQPPAVSLAPPQRQSIEQQAAGQATGFVPPMQAMPMQATGQPQTGEFDIEMVGGKPMAVAPGMTFGGEKVEQQPVGILSQDKGPDLNQVQRDLVMEGKQPQAEPNIFQKAVSYGKDLVKSVERGLARGKAANVAKPTNLFNGTASDAEIDEIARINREIKQIGGTAVEQDFSKHEGVWDTITDWIKVAPPTLIESMAMLGRSGYDEIAAGTAVGAGAGSIVPVIGTAAGAATGFTAGSIAAGAGVEFFSSFFGELEKMGVDTGNPQAIKAALKNPEILSKARKTAAIRAGVIGGGSALVGAAASGLKPIASGLTQAAGEFGVELGAQAASGQDINLEEAGLEAIGELPVSAITAKGFQAARKAAPTQLGGIPTIPAPPNAPEFQQETIVGDGRSEWKFANSLEEVPEQYRGSATKREVQTGALGKMGLGQTKTVYTYQVPVQTIDITGAAQTTYETVSPEELQAFQTDPNFATNNPERAAAIADDVALIQSGQMDINSIDDPNYRLMVESAMGVGQQEQQGGAIIPEQFQRPQITLSAPEITVSGSGNLFIPSLRKLGYTDEEISGMTMEQQQEIVSNRIEPARAADSSKVDVVKENAKQERLAEMNAELDREETPILPSNEQLPLADQAAQNMGTAVNQPLETGAAAVEVGKSGRPVVEVEGDQVVEEEKPLTKEEQITDLRAKEQAEGKAKAPKAGSVGVGGEVEPIRQLGTGANVYFETDGYRVNDGKDGKTYLIIRDENDKTGFPLNTIEFDNVTEAVFVANKISEIRPDGLTNEYNIDKIVDSFKEEYKQSLKEAPKPKGKATIIIEEKPKEPLIPKQKLEKIKGKVKSDPNVLLRTGKIEGKNTGFFAIPEQGGPFVDDSFNDLGVNEETSAYTMPNDFKVKDLSNMVFDDYKKNKEDEKARAEGYDGVKIMEMDGTTVMDVVNPKKLIKLDESLPELRNEKLQEASSKTRKAEGGQSAKQSSQPTEKKPRKRGRSINVQAAMNVQLPNNKEAAVMQTILENPLSEDILQSIFGGPDTQAKSGRKSIKGERSARISMLKKNGVKSVGKMAELAASKLAEWDGSPDAMPNDFSDGLEDLVIDTILNYNSKEAIAKDLLAMANLEQQQFDEQWYAGQQNEDLVRESEGIVDALTDEEFVELLGLEDEGVAEFLDNWNEERAESEKSPEQKEAEKIVSEAKQKVSDAEKALKQASNAAGQSLNVPLGEKTPLGLTVQRGNADAQRKVKEAETALELAKSDLGKAESQLDKLKGKKTSQLEIDTKANPLTPFQTKDKEGVKAAPKTKEQLIQSQSDYDAKIWASEVVGQIKESENEQQAIDFLAEYVSSKKDDDYTRAWFDLKQRDFEKFKQYAKPSVAKDLVEKAVEIGFLTNENAKRFLPQPVESILAPFSTKDKEGQAARAALKESVGPTEFKRLENIAKNGEKILRSLDGKIIKIDCP